MGAQEYFHWCREVDIAVGADEAKLEAEWKAEDKDGFNVGRCRDSLELERNLRVLGCEQRRKIKNGKGFRGKWARFLAWCGCWGK
jgi:hypothetical protein